MTHLVLGGTGTVGSAVVRRLVNAGESVKVLTRSADKAKALPKGVQGVVGDLGNPDTYATIFRDFDNIFVLNLVTQAELQEGLAAINEAHKAGAKRLVYLSVHLADQGFNVPHYIAKATVENAIKNFGMPYTILRPNNFFQNDFWFKEIILNYNTYPQPLGSKGCSRIDVEDIAEAAFNALTKPGFLGKTYNLVGAEALTGEDNARIWSEALGQKIDYAGDDLQQWAKTFSPYMPNWLIYDFGLMYHMFQTKGNSGTPAQIKETEEILGRKAHRFADWVKSTAPTWKQTAKV